MVFPFNILGDALILATSNRLQIWQQQDTTEFSRFWELQSEDSATIQYDEVAFAGHRSVFATQSMGTVSVWTFGDQDGYEAQPLTASSSICHFSWKPWKDNIISSGAWCTQPTVVNAKSSTWYEAPKMLLTLDDQNTIQIWVETKGEPREYVVCATINDAPKLTYVKWLDVQPRALSDDRFRDVGNVVYDWLTGVDASGVMHLWKINDLDIHIDSAPLVAKTEFRLKILDDLDDAELGQWQWRIGTPMSTCTVFSW